MKVEKANPGRITVFFDQRHYLWLNTDIDPCVVCSAILVFFLLYIRRPFCIPFASYKSTVFIPMSRNVRMPTSRPKSCKLQSPLRTNDVSSGMVSSFLNCAKLKGCLSVVGMGGFFTFENGES